MPELPEVEVVRRGLARHVVDRTIAHVDVAHPRAVRRHIEGGGDFAARLVGRTITAARRRGKYLWLELDCDRSGADAVLAHLGMSGQMLVAAPGRPAEKHLRIRIAFDDDGVHPSSGTELRFVDQRTFGGLSVHPLVPAAFDGRLSGELLPAPIAHIARDPMDPLFDEGAFVARVRRRASGVKRILLDQTVVSGVGNIYADEGLWRAQLHGDRLGTRLRRSDVERLLVEVRTVMAAALAEGGTSFDTLYVNVNGESGYFDRSLHAYGQDGHPCDRCGTPIVRVAFMNRSSYFCPVCQPRPRPRRAHARAPR